jgi:hypothetical protein
LRRVDTGEDISANGGYMDLEVEHIFYDGVTAVIRTVLPKNFPLNAGDLLEVFEEEILYRNKSTDH